MKKTQYSDYILDQNKDLFWTVDKNPDLVYTNSDFYELKHAEFSFKKKIKP